MNGILADEMGLGKVRVADQLISSSVISESFFTPEILLLDDAIYFNTGLHDGI